MNTIIKTVLISMVLMCLLTGCNSLPPNTLYTEPIAGNVEVTAADSDLDISYSINCHLMQRKKDDFISFTVDTMLYTYRLDFSVYTDMRKILDKFFHISEMASARHKKNGKQYLGEAILYAYASCHDTQTRLSVTGQVPNRLRFSFLMKNGEKFLLLEGFHAKTIDGKLPVDNYVNGVPFRYDDIKKAYDFFSNDQAVAESRMKQMQIANSAQNADAAANTEHTIQHIDSTPDNTADTEPQP